MDMKVMGTECSVINEWPKLKRFLSSDVIGKIDLESTEDCTENNPRYVIRAIGVTVRKEEDIEIGLKELARKIELANSRYNIIGSLLPCFRLSARSSREWDGICLFSYIAFSKPNPFDGELFLQDGDIAPWLIPSGGLC